MTGNCPKCGNKTHNTRLGGTYVLWNCGTQYVDGRIHQSDRCRIGWKGNNMTITLAKPQHVLELETLDACREAIEYASTHPDAEAAWAVCTRGDWMLWLAGKLSGPPESDGRRTLVACACECARLSLPIFEKRYPDDKRVRNCLDVAERWARGEATIEELRVARRAAYAAADAAADASAYAATAAYTAAYAYEDAAAAAAAATAAAAYAAAYTYAAAYAAAGSRVRAECTNIVRRHYPQPPQIESAALAGKEVT